MASTCVALVALRKIIELFGWLLAGPSLLPAVNLGIAALSVTGGVDAAAVCTQSEMASGALRMTAEAEYPARGESFTPQGSPGLKTAKNTWSACLFAEVLHLLPNDCGTGPLLSALRAARASAAGHL